MACPRPPHAAEPSRYEISVEPIGEAWCVRAAHTLAETSFMSGWQAELAARALARSLASAGHYSAIRIYVRSGELVGTILSGPDEPLVH